MLHPEKPEKPGAANDIASFTGGFMLQWLVTQCTSAGWCILSEICCFIFSGVVDERLGRDVMSGFVPCSDTEPRQRGGPRRALFLVLPDISFSSSTLERKLSERLESSPAHAEAAALCVRAISSASAP